VRIGVRQTGVWGSGTVRPESFGWRMRSSSDVCKYSVEANMSSSRFAGVRAGLRCTTDFDDPVRGGNPAHHGRPP
jgi:hypothetical protein